MKDEEIFEEIGNGCICFMILLMFLLGVVDLVYNIGCKYIPEWREEREKTQQIINKNDEFDYYDGYDGEHAHGVPR